MFAFAPSGLSLLLYVLSVMTVTAFVAVVLLNVLWIARNHLT